MVKDLVRDGGARATRRPVLVGASMGGGTSLVAIGEDHVDATALVLVDIAPRIEPEGVDRIQAFMSQKPEGFDSLQEVADAIASYQPHRNRPKNLDGLAKNVRLGAGRQVPLALGPGFAAFARTLDKRQDRLEACARRLTLPTLLVRGGLSDVLSEEGAQDFLKLCPHSEYVNVTGAGPHGGGGPQRHLRQCRDRIPGRVPYLRRAHRCIRLEGCIRTTKARRGDVKDVP